MLIDLNDLTVFAISWAALKCLNASPSAVVGRPVANVLPDQGREASLRALRAMRDGAIDRYSSHHRLGAEPDGVVTEWVRGFRFGDRRVALSEAAVGIGLRGSPLAEYLGREPITMAVGTVNSEWAITSASTEIHELLGITDSEAVGRRFLCSVEQIDIWRLLQAGGRASGQDSAAFRLVLHDRSGRRTPACCVLTSLAGSTDLFFILIREAGSSAEPDTARVSKLEQHLRRIAVEVENSGILLQLNAMPDPARLSQLAGLTDRQSEVLSRLMRGERVPTIAKALYVSQSTVRNHLAGIFKQFRVHSQAELLASLTTDTRPFAVGARA
jgi:DNA-binding CsgD family transcriptional regulator